MEPNVEAVQPQFRSGVSGPKPGGMGFVFDDIQGLISGPPETDGSSFTALLGLPPPQAVELLVKEDYPPAKTTPPPIFPSNVALIDRASMFSVFGPADYQPESTNILPASASMKIEAVKEEPLESEHRPNSSSSDRSLKSSKRKERETKVKESSKKSKKVGANESSDGSGEQLPYVHVRARRGQATDSHSLAERARREKINARMKLLQDLVPGCNKISGTAMVLDEIINHVQALQRQVEFLSMKLAAVNPRIDFNFDALLESDSIDNSFLNVLPPSIWPEGQQINSSRQQQQQYPQPWLLDGLDDDQPSMDNRADDTSNFLNTDNPLLSYDSPANSVGSASLHSSQLKMEL